MVRHLNTYRLVQKFHQRGFFGVKGFHFSFSCNVSIMYDAIIISPNKSFKSILYSFCSRGFYFKVIFFGRMKTDFQKLLKSNVFEVLTVQLNLAHKLQYTCPKIS